MFKNMLLPAILFISIFVSSCSPAKPAKAIPQPLPSPSDGWTAALTQSGGFAGVLLTVEVSSDGQLKAEDQRARRSVTQRLSPQAVAQLQQLISNTKVSSGAAPRSTFADCFLYDLVVESNGNSFRVHADDVTFKNSGAADLIALLRQLRDQALSASQ